MVLAVVALAGCTAPIPAPVEVAAPPPVLSIECGEAVERESLGRIFAPDVVVRSDTQAGVTDARQVVLRAAGAVECVWGGETMLGTTYAEGLSFVALPDAREPFLEHVEPVIDTQYATIDTAGERSQFACGYGQCSFDVLVANVWVAGSLSAPGRGDELLADGVQRILEQIAQAVGAAAASAGPSWELPAGVVGSWGSCEDGSPIVTGLRTVFDKDDLFPAGEPIMPIDAAASARVSASTCSLWADDLTLFVSADLVPGGGWALDRLAAADPLLGAFEPLTVGDAEGAVACADGVGCVAQLAVGGSLVSLRAQPAEHSDFTARLGSFVQVVADAIAQGSIP